MKRTKNLRIIPVKSMFSADPFLEFEEECDIKEISMSTVLFELAKDWTKKQKHSRQQANKELPSCGHNLANSYSGRSYGQVKHGAVNHMRRRL